MIIPHLPPLPAPTPLLATLATAVTAALITRPRPVWATLVAPLATLAGWTALLSSWPAILWPRTLVDHLSLPAALVCIASLATQTHNAPANKPRKRGPSPANRLPRHRRWLAFAATLASAWWLSYAPVARPEFWRVGFAVLALAVALPRLKAAQPAYASTIPLTLALGLIATQPPTPWTTVNLILLLGILATRVVSPSTPIAPTLLAVAVAGTNLATGQLIRAHVTAADLLCLAALLSPLLATALDRNLRRRTPRLAEPLSAVLAALGAVAAAWTAARLF